MSDRSRSSLSPEHDPTAFFLRQGIDSDHDSSDSEAGPSSHLISNGASSSSSTSTDPSLVPKQRHSEIDERAVVRYYRDGRKRPFILQKRRDKLDFSAGSSSLLEGQDGAPADDEGQRFDVALRVDVTDGCGGRIWPAAEVLGAYIASKRVDDVLEPDGTRRSSWKGKTVVELGSGTGLVGLLVARMGLGAETWITDQIPMMPLMEDNKQLNEPLPDPCHVAELNWGEPIPSGVPPKPDVLLLADCVYLESAFSPLVSTLLDLSLPPSSSDASQTEILFCYQQRRKADRRFFVLLKKRFHFFDVEDDDPERNRMYTRQGTRLYRVVRREEGGKAGSKTKVGNKRSVAGDQAPGTEAAQGDAQDVVMAD